MCIYSSCRLGQIIADQFQTLYCSPVLCTILSLPSVTRVTSVLLYTVLLFAVLSCALLTLLTVLCKVKLLKLETTTQMLLCSTQCVLPNSRLCKVDVIVY